MLIGIRGDLSETNRNRRLLDGLGTHRVADQCGENAVRTDCEGRASTRGRFAAAYAPARALRRQRQGTRCR
jgi:hypothetical protein